MTTRGIDRRLLYRDDADYETFTAIVARAVLRFRWLLHGYCLMPNHYHLLVETPEPTLARGMRYVNGSYARRFNDRYDRRGHVFESRYHSGLVDTEGHYLETIRYVALNPVRAGLCGRPEEWRWGSHRALAGLDPVQDHLARSRVLELIGRDPRGLAGFVLDARDKSRDQVRGHVP